MLKQVQHDIFLHFPHCDTVFPGERVGHSSPSKAGGHSEGSTMEKALEKIAEQILSFDEASLVHLREKYRSRIEHFDGTKDWERAVIIFCVINAVSMKNALFNENVLKKVKHKKEERSSPPKQGHSGLKRVK
jgi:hypothetical protein